MRNDPIKIALPDPIRAALRMMLADLNNADPGANWDEDRLAASIVESVVLDDFRMHVARSVAH